MDTLQASLIKRIKQQMEAETIPGAHDADYPPVTLFEVEAAEQALGFRLPELLRQLYIQVANGGFGPEYGVIGLENGYENDVTDETLVDTYFSYLIVEDNATFWKWSKGLVPICHRGCNIQSCIDCTKPEAPIILFDPNVSWETKGWETCFSLEAITLDQWFEKWLDESAKKK